jgi:hypothetical protein
MNVLRAYVKCGSWNFEVPVADPCFGSEPPAIAGERRELLDRIT